MNILIVEDESMIAEALQDILRIMGHSTHWISNGNNIAPVLESEQFPLVIVDLELPGKPGLEVAKEILAGYPDTNIIFSTGFSDQVDALDQLQQHSYQLIHKPFDINDIRNAIANIAE